MKYLSRARFSENQSTVLQEPEHISLKIRAHLSWRTGKHLHVLHVLRTCSTCSYPGYQDTATYAALTSTNSNFQAQLHCAGLLLSPKLYAPPQPGQVLPVGEPVLVLLQMLGLLVHLQGHLLPQPALLSDSTMELTLSGPQVSVPSVAHHVMSLWFCLSCETC